MSAASIFDFGPEDSTGEGAVLDQLRDLFRPYPNTFLLLPSRDKEQSMFALFRDPSVGLEAAERNRWFLDSPSHEELAAHTIVRSGLSADDVAERIFSLAVGLDRSLSV